MMLRLIPSHLRYFSQEEKKFQLVNTMVGISVIVKVAIVLVLESRSSFEPSNRSCSGFKPIQYPPTVQLKHKLQNFVLFLPICRSLKKIICCRLYQKRWLCKVVGAENGMAYYNVWDGIKKQLGLLC